MLLSYSINGSQFPDFLSIPDVSMLSVFHESGHIPESDIKKNCSYCRWPLHFRNICVTHSGTHPSPLIDNI